MLFRSKAFKPVYLSISMKIIDIMIDEGNLIIQTEEGLGKVKFDGKIDLNKYKGLEINSFEDFKKIDTKVRDYIELAFLDSIERPWKFINKDAKQLPRPLSVVYKKEKGFSEFLLLALDAKSILKSLWINKKINEKLKFDEEDDETILMKIQDEIDKIKNLVDFNVRIGINVNGDAIYKDGKYVYSNKVMNADEHYDFLVYLTESYNLVYVEDPFTSEDRESFGKFMKQVQNVTLVCGKTNNGLVNNTFLIKNKINIENKVKEIKELKIHPIMNCDSILDLHFAVAFLIPILKHNIIDSNIHDEYQRIESEIKES